MDITVSIPNGKVDNVVTALNAQPPPRWEAPPEGATAAQVKDHLAAYFSEYWKDGVRQVLRNHRRSEAIAAAAEADRTQPDPLA